MRAQERDPAPVTSREPYHVDYVSKLCPGRRLFRKSLKVKSQPTKTPFSHLRKKPLKDS